PWRSATMSRASLRTLKWPDSVESASGKCSAISPALRSRARSSHRISRRVGSLRARKTLSSCRRASELISSTNEIYAAGPASARVFGGLTDTPRESIVSRSVRLARTRGFLRVRDRTYETVRDSTRATPWRLSTRSNARSEPRRGARHNNRTRGSGLELPWGCVDAAAGPSRTGPPALGLAYVALVHWICA